MGAGSVWVGTAATVVDKDGSIVGAGEAVQAERISSRMVIQAKTPLHNFTIIEFTPFYLCSCCRFFSSPVFNWVDPLDRRNLSR